MSSTVSSCLQHAKALGLTPLEAEWLLLFALHRSLDDRAWLRMSSQDHLEPHTVECFQSLCLRRVQHEPLAYITGQREFYGLLLLVDARVLDPRPDTETLVDWALDVLQGLPSPWVVDLGTGSGAIALALQHMRPDAHVLAIDASADALDVASANASRLKLAVNFAKGNWLEPLARYDKGPRDGWQLMVSNPPYIATGDHHLRALRHEPLQALTSGPDGLDDIRHLIKHAPMHLANHGWLLLEHGHDQSAAVQALMKQRGFEDVQSRNDLAGIARCTGGQWKHKANAG